MCQKKNIMYTISTFGHLSKQDKQKKTDSEKEMITKESWIFNIYFSGGGRNRTQKLFERKEKIIEFMNQKFWIPDPGIKKI